MMLFPGMDSEGTSVGRSICCECVLIVPIFWILVEFVLKFMFDLSSWQHWQVSMRERHDSASFLNGFVESQ